MQQKRKKVLAAKFNNSCKIYWDCG